MKYMLFLLSFAVGVHAADKFCTPAIPSTEVSQFNSQTAPFIPQLIVDMYTTQIWQSLNVLVGEKVFVRDYNSPDPAGMKQMPVLETALGKLYWQLALNGINETLTANSELVNRADGYYNAAHAHPAMLRSLVLAKMFQDDIDIPQSAYYWDRYHRYISSHITRSVRFQIAILTIEPTIAQTITENAEVHAEMAPEFLFEFKAHLLARFHSLKYQFEQDPILFRKRFDKFIQNS